MTLKNQLIAASAAIALVSAAGSAFAQDVTLTIESWRTDDLAVAK